MYARSPVQPIPIVLGDLPTGDSSQGAWLCTGSRAKTVRYAVRDRADILDGDVRWTKDGPDRDSVGTMIILHDATLDRITNCEGPISERLWSSIRAKGRTDVGGRQLLRFDRPIEVR